jgi:pimeloyl-ACP methyl ester carboxylesterase
LHSAYASRHEWDGFIPVLQQAGFSVLAVDLRGHGQTGGELAWEKMPKDTPAMLATLRSRPEVEPQRIGIIGASIGANLALAEAARDPQMRAVALLSPGLNYFTVDTIEPMKAYGARPVFIAVAEKDGFAASSSQELAKIAQGPVELKIYPGESHGTELLRAQNDLSGVLIDWLKRQFLDDPAPQ